MIDFSERNRIMNILSKRYGQNISMRDSNLLRLYATMKAMHDTRINQPESADETVLAQYSMYQYGPIFKNGTLSPVFFYDIWPDISKLSYLDFLTYIVPGIACDPKRTLAIFQKYNGGFHAANEACVLTVLAKLTYRICNSFQLVLGYTIKQRKQIPKALLHSIVFCVLFRHVGIK